MDAYISTLKQQADRGDVAACAALLNHAGLQAIADKLQAMTDAFCVLQDAVHDTDAYYEIPALPPDDELATVPDEVPPVVIEPEPAVEPAKPVRSRATAPRTEL